MLRLPRGRVLLFTAESARHPRIVDEAALAREAAVWVELVDRALRRRDHALQAWVARPEERHLPLARLLPYGGPSSPLLSGRGGLRLGPRLRPGAH
eukprot:8974434-Lingulodinium_polyedra.AAC.1